MLGIVSYGALIGKEISILEALGELKFDACWTVIVLDWIGMVCSKSNVSWHYCILWLALHNKLLTKDKLYARRITDSDVLVLCNQAREDVSHLFFNCGFSNDVWVRALKFVNIQRSPYDWHREISWFLRKASGKTLLAKMRRTVLSSNVYLIWRAQNLQVF